MADPTSLKIKSADIPRSERALLESLRTEMVILPHKRRPDLLCQDSAEQIRHREVSRLLRKMSLSPKEEKAIEQLSYSLVAKLLLGPISKVMAHAEIQASDGGRGVDREVSKSEARPEKRRTRKEQMV